MPPRHQKSSTTSLVSIAKQKLRNLAEVKNKLDQQLELEKLLYGFSKRPSLKMRQHMREVTGLSLDRINIIANNKFNPGKIAAENERQRIRRWEAKGLPAPEKMYNTIPKDILAKLRIKLSNYVSKNRCNPSLKVRRMWAKSVPGGVAAVSNWARKNVCWLPKGIRKPKSTIIKKRKEENLEERSASDFIQGDEYDALFESEDDEGDSDDGEQMTSDDFYTPGKIEVNGDLRQSSRLQLKASICSSTNNIPENVATSPTTSVIEEIPARELRDRESRRPLSEISSLKLTEKEIKALIKCMREGELDDSMRLFKLVCEGISDENLRIFEKATLKLYSTDLFLTLFQIIASHNKKKPLNKHIALVGYDVLQQTGSIKNGMCFENTECTRFVYPICVENHFSILFFDKDKRSVTHADSYLEKILPDPVIKSFAAKLKMEVTSIIRLDGTRLVRQTLTNSCGVHTVGFCHLFLSNGFDAPNIKMNVNALALRKQMKEFIHTLNRVREKLAE